MKTPLLEIRNLKKFFPVKNSLGRVKGYIKAVNNITFSIYEGETYGMVGESGCGKSTTGRTILRLIEATSGEVIYRQLEDILKLDRKRLRELRKDFQIVFQDPYSSLNPKYRIGRILEEPLTIHNIGKPNERTERVIDILCQVGLQPEHYYRYPHELSGGQRQRICLARALTVEPKVIICDEPVSALDVSIQSQILNLLEEIQEKYHLTYLFITHNLSVVHHIADRIGVMYLGELVEDSPTEELFLNPLHPYTKALLSSVPQPNPKNKMKRIPLMGEVPSALNPPLGCVFHTRCPMAKEICRQEKPVKKEIASSHYAACHLL
jgi:oligopeptide/dipeptide ABC transporter ATP-binding protein